MAEISIPGDPGGLSALASQLRAAADGIATVGGRVGENGLDGSWSGQAANAFRASVSPLPGELSKVFAAFVESSQALARFATRLAELQQKARWYEGQLEAARQEQSAAEARQARAQTELDTARRGHSLATDPASLHTTGQAVDLGESAVGQAVADVEDAVARAAKLVAAAVSLRQEYEDAVNSCCAALGGARHSGGSPLAGISRAVSGLAGRVDRGLALWWHSGARDLEELLSDGHDLVDVVDQFVEGVLPVSKLGHWAVPVVRIANSPTFRAAGKAFAVFAVIGGIGDVRDAWRGSRGESGPGRDFTVGFTAASDGAMMWSPLGGANLLSLGAVSADFKAIALIGGGAISGGSEGASRADEQFSENALRGDYLPPVKYIAKGENWAIDHAYQGVYTGVHATEGFAEDVWHGGGSLLGRL